jgi:hypothetical protein
MKKTITIFSAIVFIFLFTSCQKEYSYEGGSFPAGSQPLSFMLEGAPDSCFSYLLNGNYRQNAALTVDNTVSVMVNVFTPGPFSIKTKTINGMNFSVSGNFIFTGSQELILKGKGKPVNPGTFTFKPNSGFSSCTFDVTVTKDIPTASYHLPINPDGTCSSYLSPGTYYHGTPLNNNIIVVTVDVDKPGDFTISTNTTNGIVFSGAGTFTKTGMQKVQFIGRGSPLEIGVFVFSPYIVIDGSPVGNGCNLDVYVF